MAKDFNPKEKPQDKGKPLPKPTKDFSLKRVQDSKDIPKKK